MKQLAILGSTGSIGRQCLSVIEALPGRFGVVALAAGANLEELVGQIERHQPEVVSVGDAKRADDLSLHVGEAEVAALEAVLQAGVVEAEQVQQRRLQVVDMNPVVDHVEAEVVAGAERDAGLDAAAGQPHGEGVGVMVAAVTAALHHRRAAEFAAPDDQRVVEHAALLQI